MINIIITERKTNHIFSFEFNVKDYIHHTTTDQTYLNIDRNNYRLSSLINNVEEFKNKFQIFLYSNHIIPGTIPTKINIATSVEDTTVMYTVESPPPQDLFTDKSFQHQSSSSSNKIHYKDNDTYPSSNNNSNSNNNNINNQPPSTAAKVGNTDLDPFPQRIWIDPNTNSTSMPSSLGPIPPGAGNYIGPDHPIFNPDYYNNNEDNDQYPNYHGDDRNIFNTIPPEYLPQPRFDPYGPVIGPNTDINVGNVGVDSRGRRIISPRHPGRRPGRGPPHQGLFPGEPNPDHLKPPGW